MKKMQKDSNKIKKETKRMQMLFKNKEKSKKGEKGKQLKENINLMKKKSLDWSRKH